MNCAEVTSQAILSEQTGAGGWFVEVRGIEFAAAPDCSNRIAWHAMQFSAVLESSAQLMAFLFASNGYPLVEIPRWLHTKTQFVLCI